MAYYSSNVIRKLLLACFMVSMATSRPLNFTSLNTTAKTTLATRLTLDEGDSGSSNCWGSLLELQSCTGEVILFFLNGETYLGPGCCRAIGTIEHHCWPTMMGTLGFTAEEGDVLRGYCDAASDSNPTTKAPPHSVNTTTYYYNVTLPLLP